MLLKNKIAIIASIAFAVVLIFVSISISRVNLPAKPSNYVVDLADIVDDRVEMRLNAYLLELEQKTTAQVVILTIPGLDGEPIEEFSLHVAHDLWKIGQKGKDNGLLLLVSVGDRKYRFEVGYGLEGTLPDSLVGSVGREYLIPYFRKDDYSSGIAAATLAVIQQIAREANVEITGMPKLRSIQNHPYSRIKKSRPSLFGSILSILFFIGLIYLFIRHPRLLLFFLFLNMLGGGRRTYWGGGGGFGGSGGFGGFGGGGGGFGGGGASGGW